MILVTGAGGTVGKELVKRLAATGVPFRAGFSTAEKVERARRDGIPGVLADFARPGTLPSALDGADTLFLLSGWSPRQTEIEISVVFEARRAGVRRLVKLSVWEADREAFSYARIHRPVERAIEESGIPWTFLRPNSFMQNFVGFFAGSIKAGGSFHMPGPAARISHVDVRDIAEVAAAALTGEAHSGMAYALSGPHPVTYAEIASALTKALGREVSYVPITQQQYLDAAIAAGVPAENAEALVDLTRYYAAGHAARVSPDVRQVTGRDPIPFETFALDHAHLLR